MTQFSPFVAGSNVALDDSTTPGQTTIDVLKGVTLLQVLEYNSSTLSYPGKSDKVPWALYVGPVNPASVGVTMGAKDIWRNTAFRTQLIVNFGAPITESIIFAAPVTLDLPTVGTDGSSAPTYSLASSTGMTGTQTAWSSGQRTFAAGDVLHVIVTGFGDAQKLSFAFNQS